VYSKDSSETIAVRVSDWQFASGWFSAMADESGSNPLPGREQLSSSPFPKPLTAPIRRPLNLLAVEDYLPDALLVRGKRGRD
jgi:hypothetical protein